MALTQTITRLYSLEEIKDYFATDSTPYFFVSTSNFNMLGMHDWVRGWHNLNLLDSFDNKHNSVTVVLDDHLQVFTSIEDINAYLLQSPIARDLFQDKQKQANKKCKVVFLFFDPAIEALCKKLELNVVLPSYDLVREIDSKIATTELGNRAGVPSVPNVLTKINSYADLLEVARHANLGSRWVVQTAYGDSGKTTFFISNKEDYDKVADQIESESAVKVMKWIRCTGTAIEACATRWGTFVGPLLTEVIGAPELTPYAGGWCGNELYESSHAPEIRAEALRLTQAMGRALYQRGYRGYFELDYLIDLDSGAVYLGELNARITGISAMTNLSDFAYKTVPLFLFHLLEYDETVDLALDASSFNQQVLTQGAQGVASQIILKQTEPMLKIVTEAPVSGVYGIDAQGRLQLKHAGHNRRAALAKDEAFVLRIMAIGEYAYKGGDLAIMFVNTTIRTTEGALNSDGLRWTQALQSCFAFRPLSQEERSAVERVHRPAHMKSERASESAA